jgi:CMP-N-acetylneuraminic acid synthetase
MTEVLALIPARGGSKGIPRKNIRDFSGYPLIAWSIAAAKQSELVTRVIVSTDDEEIAAVARAWGAETPFLRPAEFAEDKTTDLPVFVHALAWLAENENYRPDVVVQLRPTSPIRPSGWWMMRCASCSRTPRRIQCGESSQPGKTRIKCGVWLRVGMGR